MVIVAAVADMVRYTAAVTDLVVGMVCIVSDMVKHSAAAVLVQCTVAAAADIVLLQDTFAAPGIAAVKT